MSAKLDRLIHSLDFLTAHRGDVAGFVHAVEAAALENEIANCLSEVLAVEPDDVSSAISQTRALTAAICDRSPDPKTTDSLRSICDGHLDRLREQLIGLNVRRPMPSEYQCLDSLSERVGYFDTNYRYTYTNAANCEFHKEPVGNFIGRPNWTIVGDRYFEKINKDRFDACYAGKRISYYNGHPNALGRVFSVTFDPAFDSSGRVTGALVTSRDVSLLPIPANLILPMP